MAKPLGVNFDGHPANTRAGAFRSAPAEFQVTIASTARAWCAVSNKLEPLHTTVEMNATEKDLGHSEEPRVYKCAHLPGKNGNPSSNPFTTDAG